jgi:hypothetical protein
MIERLACKLGRNDEVPNIELAEYLCQQNDENGIREIVEGFKSNDKAVTNDCIKVLYEIGERNPDLIYAYANDFINSLYSKNNRIIWGSMTALAKIAVIASQPINEKIGAVITAYENGSTITIDNSISVFSGIYKANAAYEKEILPILLTHLQNCRPKEVPQHAERMSICFNKTNANDFIEVLMNRSADLTPPWQSRINKLLKKLNRLSS